MKTIALWALALAPLQLSAQTRVPRASQHGSVSQTLTGVTVVVDYDRPVARGRELFGGIVHWGEFWTPGANWATTIEADAEFSINGNRLAAGEYSMWMIPQELEWTVVISADDSVFHTRRPDADLEAARFTVEPEIADQYFDALSFYFPTIGPNYGTLVMHWGNTRIPLRIEVDAYPALELSGVNMSTYTGTYRRPDSNRSISVRVEDGVLTASGFGRFDTELVPVGPHSFRLGNYIDGELWAIYSESTEIVFDVVDGQAGGFTVFRDGAERWSARR